MLEPASEKRVLRVQTVLYNTDAAQIWRLLRGLDAAAADVLKSGLVSQVDWAIGDSSLAPSLTERDVADLAGARQVVDGFSYDFFGENLGSSGGQNRLAESGVSDLIFVLNPDTYPSPGALHEMVKALFGVRVGIADARQIPLEHPKVYDEVHGDTSWASGACTMVWTELFRDLGGYDHEHFLLHCDDVDLSWRARAAGWRVVTAPLATIFHDKRPTRDTSWPAPDVERYQSLLGRLMLATRWNRPDIVEETIEYVDDYGDDVVRDAVAEYQRRIAAGRVPSVASNPAVAEFVEGEYAVHRF